MQSPTKNNTCFVKVGNGEAEVKYATPEPGANIVDWAFVIPMKCTREQLDSINAQLAEKLL